MNFIVCLLLSTNHKTPVFAKSDGDEVSIYNPNTMDILLHKTEQTKRPSANTRCQHCFLGPF